MRSARSLSLRASPSDGIAALERRALQLEHRIAHGAWRILQVDDKLVPAVRAAISELKDELQRVRATIEMVRRHATLPVTGEDLVRKTIDGFKSMASVVRDPTFPLERRKEVLRRLLPMRDGVRPIRVDVDVNAKRGWRNALRRVTVRHLTFRNEVCQANVVAGTVTAEAEQPAAPGWELAELLPTWEWELVTANFVEVGDLVGAGAEIW